MGGKQLEGAAAARNNSIAQSVLRRIFLVMAVMIVTALFALPVAFYFIYEYTSINSSSKAIVSSDMPSFNSSSNGSTDTTVTDSDCKLNLQWVSEEVHHHSYSNEGTCSYNSYEYYGEVCEEVLLEWAHCTIGNGSVDTSIPIALPYQSKNDEDIQQISTLLNSYPECQSKALPFLCQYYYPLVDCTTGHKYTASKDECTNITTTVCSVPWYLAVLAGMADQLPKCDSLKGSSNNNLTNVVNSTITCEENFLEVGGACVPSCITFHFSLYSYYVFEYVCLTIAGISGVTAFVIVMVYSIRNRKRIIKFPTVYTLFLLTEFGIAGFTILLTNIVGSRAFCPSENLLELANNNPTGFCIFYGAIFHYILVSLTIWWLIHLSLLVFRVACPFRAHQLSNNKIRYQAIHWSLVVIGLLLPLPAVIVSLTTTENRYRPGNLPPRACNPPNKMWFYSVILPINILLTIGVCFLCYIIWIFNKIRRGSLKKTIIGPGERKLIVVFVLYLVFGVYALIQSNITIANSDKLTEELTAYFQCEAGGHVPGKCSRSGFEEVRYPILVSVLFLLFSVIPFGVLSFIMDWQACFKLFKCKKSRKLSRKWTTTSLVKSIPV